MRTTTTLSVCNLRNLIVYSLHRGLLWIRFMSYSPATCPGNSIVRLLSDPHWNSIKHLPFFYWCSSAASILHGQHKYHRHHSPSNKMPDIQRRYTCSCIHVNLCIPCRCSCWWTRHTYKSTNAVQLALIQDIHLVQARRANEDFIIIVLLLL